MVIAKDLLEPGPPCQKCGHLGPFVPKIITGQKDPREGLEILCAVCRRDITYDSHQWQDQKSRRYVCCDCMVPTKPIRDMTKPRTTGESGSEGLTPSRPPPEGGSR